MSSCFVVQIDIARKDKLKEDLENQGFTFTTPAYTIFQATKKGISCTLYNSGKLTVQGSEMKEFIEYYLEPEFLGTFSFGYENLEVDLGARIGVDESGKGDFFGPLCIAGVYAEGEAVKNLATIGVKDSKKLQDASILKIAQKIRESYAHEIVRIGPEKYNELYLKFGNLNLLLGWGHATVIDLLMEKTKCERVIIDQFAAEHVVANALKRKNKKALLTQRPKAEQDLVVAAASILARAAFVDGISKLEDKIGMPLPKGASKATLEAGEKIVREKGASTLNLLSKTHFKTYTEILERCRND